MEPNLAPEEDLIEESHQNISNLATFQYNIYHLNPLRHARIEDKSQVEEGKETENDNVISEDKNLSFKKEKVDHNSPAKHFINPLLNDNIDIKVDFVSKFKTNKEENIGQKQKQEEEQKQENELEVEQEREGEQEQEEEHIQENKSEPGPEKETQEQEDQILKDEKEEGAEIINKNIILSQAQETKSLILHSNEVDASGSPPENEVFNPEKNQTLLKKKSASKHK